MIFSFGNYSGGKFYIHNNALNLFEVYNTYKTIVEFDGRIKHYVSNVTCGERYSIVFLTI